MESNGQDSMQNNGGGALTPEQIKQLEVTLTNFITNKKANGESAETLLAVPRTRAGHGSHVQE